MFRCRLLCTEAATLPQGAIDFARGLSYASSASRPPLNAASSVTGSPELILYYGVGSAPASLPWPWAQGRSYVWPAKTTRHGSTAEFT